MSIIPSTVVFNGCELAGSEMRMHSDKLVMGVLVWSESNVHSRREAEGQPNRKTIRLNLVSGI